MQAKLFFVFLLFVTFIWCLEVVPEMPKLEYYNPKYISYMKLSIRKYNRTSPHFIDLDITTLTQVGNNVTLGMKLLEKLSGRYHPTAVQGSYKFCDFLHNEPFLGKMYAKYLPANWTCPFPPDAYKFHNVVIHLENFPFNIPFTWASYFVSTRADVEGYVTDTKELLFKWKCYVAITQKPKNKVSV